MRAITGTKVQMTTAAAVLDSLMEFPNAATKTTTWAAPELLDDGITWALRVPLKGSLAAVRARVQAIGLAAVIADIKARTGRTINQTQAQTLLDAIRDAVEHRTIAEANAVLLP